MFTRENSVYNRSLFWDLSEMLDHNHELYLLANKIDWAIFNSFEKFYRNFGRPSVSVRRLTGLLILKHLRNVSDEEIVKQYKENAYYQYFCGESAFSIKEPCSATELVEFRKRIGESGIELILKESIRVNVEEDDKNNQGNGKRGRKAEKDQTIFIDSTVQEKNITFPTDSKLLNKVIKYCYKVADKSGIKLKQTYEKEVKELKKVQRWRGRSHMKKKVAAADRRMRTIAGRLVREILRKINDDSAYIDLMDICNKFVKNEKYNGHKIYSIHEPDTFCICKGKDHKKYEFGNKVSIARTYDGLIVGALSFRNEYDGHTLAPQLDQVNRLYSKMVKYAACDRGYRGVNEINGVKILIPDTPKKTDNQYQKNKKHRLFCKRAGIEPVIGHCKSDHRLGRNFYKGVYGDKINIMLAAAAFNFKRAAAAIFLGLIFYICYNAKNMANLLTNLCRVSTRKVTTSLVGHLEFRFQ